MPTPIGHTLSSALVFYLFPVQKIERVKIFLFSALYSILPDLDFLPGFIEGNPNKYHHQFTHSVAFVVVAALVGLLFFIKNKSALWIIAALFFSSGLLHLGLDMLAVDNTMPRGIPLFWPLSNHYFISPFTPFSDVYRASHSSIFFKSLFNTHNIRTVVIEIILLGPVTYCVYWLKSHKKGTNV